jgi:hypothetical protein
MLGNAVSSRTPSDFHSMEVMPPQGGTPLMKPRTETGPQIGWPHCAVGMQRAVESAIGLPSSSTSASRMLGFVTPPEVRRSRTPFRQPLCAQSGFIASNTWAARRS